MYFIKADYANDANESCDRRMERCVGKGFNFWSTLRRPGPGLCRRTSDIWQLLIGRDLMTRFERGWGINIG